MEPTPPIPPPVLAHPPREESGAVEKKEPREKEELDILFKEIIQTQDFYCPILHSLMMNPITLKCGHNFEKRGIDRWFAQNARRFCPLCNKDSPDQGSENLFLKNTIEAWKKVAKPEPDPVDPIEAGAKAEPQLPVRKMLSSEEIKAKMMDVGDIYKQGPEGIQVALDILLNLQAEYPEQQAFANAVQQIFSKLYAQPQYLPSSPFAQGPNFAPTPAPHAASSLSRHVIHQQAFNPLNLQVSPAFSKPAPMPMTYRPAPLPPNFPKQVLQKPYAFAHAPAAFPVSGVASPKDALLRQLSAQQRGPSMLPPGYSIGQRLPLPSSQTPAPAQLQPESRRELPTPIKLEEAARPAAAADSRKTSRELNEEEKGIISSRPEKKSRKDDSSDEIQIIDEVKAEQPLIRLTSDKVAEIFDLARRGSFKAFKEALKPNLVKSIDTDKNTLLHVVVMEAREIKFIHLLINAGLSINATNQAGDTALHLASQMKLQRQVIALMKHRPDQTIRNKDGLTPDEMCKGKKADKIRDLLHGKTTEKESEKKDSPGN